MEAEARTLAVAAGIVLWKGRVFVARRSEGRDRAGLWEFPGGKIEAGEDAGACLVREFIEEFGVRVRPAREYARVSAGGIELICLLASMEGGPRRLRDHGAVAWLRPEELEELDFCEADRPVARRLATEDIEALEAALA
jgi:8-oxo-dGTP diphosphatase